MPDGPDGRLAYEQTVSPCHLRDGRSTWAREEFLKAPKAGESDRSAGPRGTEENKWQPSSSTTSLSTSALTLNPVQAPEGRPSPLLLASGLSVVASCRMCPSRWRDEGRQGGVMQPRSCACQTPAKDGTVVVTNSERAKNAMQSSKGCSSITRSIALCDKAGECMLKTSATYGRGRAG